MPFMLERLGRIIVNEIMAGPSRFHIFLGSPGTVHARCTGAKAGSNERFGLEGHVEEECKSSPTKHICLIARGDPELIWQRRNKCVSDCSIMLPAPSNCHSCEAIHIYIYTHTHTP